VNKPVLDSTDQFISKLLFNAASSELPMYESEATVLGYDLHENRVAMTIRLENFWLNCLASEDQASFEREEVIKDWKRKIETKLSEFFSKHTDTITAYIGNDTFVVFKAIPEEESDQFITLLKKSFTSIFEPLKSVSVKNLVVGLSNPYNGIQGLIDAFREAHLAVDFGERLWGMNKCYYFGDLGILSILGEGNREKEMQFADQLLNKLTNDDLIDTLECFFDQNLNLTETAQHMGIHRNTVIYRLNQIASILGVDPRIFEQAMTIKIALLIKRLFG
jgi:carbohydrate diacid regulator